MCGIAGIIVKEGQASQRIAKLLQFIQHRGQDAAGICTIDEHGMPHLGKDIGLVTSIFSAERNPLDDETKKHSPLETIPLKALTGRVGVGHVRYKTIGGSGKQNAQPFYTKEPTLALSHNGHLRNYGQLEEHFGELQSSCDAEPMMKLLARELHTTSSIDDIFNAIGTTISQIDGAYSVTAAIHTENGQYLVVFRDPHSIRPCVLGTDDTSIVVASESATLVQNNYWNIQDIPPGTAVIVDQNLNIHQRTLSQKPRRHCFFEYEYFADAASIMEGIRINEIRYDFGRQLAQENLDLIDTIDAVLYVPNSAIPGTMGFAEELGLPMKIGIEKYRFGGRNFLKETREKREQDTARNLIVYEEVIQDKHLAVIDDSIVRGPTARDIIKKLKHYGAKSATFLSLTPPIRHPCHYGIATPTHDELIAGNGAALEDIRQSLGADALRYLSIDGLKHVLDTHESKVVAAKIARGILAAPQQRLTAQDFCYACLTGQTPTTGSTSRSTH